MAEDYKEDTREELKEEGSRLYWFVRNVSTKIFRGIWRWTKRHYILAVILGVVLIYVLFTSRALYHPAVLAVRKYFVLVLLLLLIAFILYKVFQRLGIVSKIIISIVFAGILAASYFWGASLYEYLGLYVHYSKLNRVELQRLPTTDHERIQPLNSIRTLVQQEALTETEESTQPYFSRRQDGRYDFSMCIGPAPEYTIQRLSKNMYRIISVSATAPAPDFSAQNNFDVNFDVGEFLLFSKNIVNSTIKTFDPLRYLSYEPSDIRYLENDAGEWVQVVSLIRWKGALIPRPIFGGVLVVDERSDFILNYPDRVLFGLGKWIKPSEVSQHPYLVGQNLVPETVTDFTANSFRFQEGFLAPMPGYHEGDIRIPKLPKDQNAMPFVAYFDFSKTGRPAPNKLYNYYGLEPFQESKRGLNTSLFIPGDGEDIVYYIDHSDRRDGYIGSSAIPSKIIESRKNYDWNTNHPAESRPYIKMFDGAPRFFWLSTVVTKANIEGNEFIGGTIPDVTLTDAHTGQVVWVEKENIAKPSLWNEQVRNELYR